MDKTAVIVAGGSGSRMGGTTPKQFMELHGKPLVVYTIEAFLAAYPDISIILVLPSNFLKQGEDIIRHHFPKAAIVVTEGGHTRFDSVRHGLKLVSHPSIVFVHDAVRCLVSPALIRQCYDAAMSHGSAIPVIPVKDSIRRIMSYGPDHKPGSEVVKRDDLRAVQTPQTFRSEILLNAFDTYYQSAFTDEATVVEHSGVHVHLVPGEEENIKVTYPSDLDYAKQVLAAKTAKS